MDIEGLNSMEWDTVDELDDLQECGIVRSKRVSDEEYTYTISTATIPSLQVTLEGVSSGNGDPLAGNPTVNMKFDQDKKVEAIELNGKFIIKRF